ncbi:MAG: peptidase inhibitor family I36 protein [Bifidobacteriaceae bacterium]|nr:peptidase inhibitor family I36 protein [Bifidobacteriaceae bacterium]
MKKLVQLILAAALVVAGGIAIQPTEAVAAPAGCAAGDACFYKNIAFSGTKGRMAQCINKFSDYGMNDTTSSLYNAGRYDTLYVYQESNGRGGVETWPKGTGSIALWFTWNDTISSAYFGSFLGYKGKSKCN